MLDLHPKEFKKNTYYWVQADHGSWVPMLLNIDMEWKIDTSPMMFIPHKAFMKMMKDTKIVEAILPE